MSLNYDTRNCNPPLPTDDNDASLKYVLEMGTMSTGIPSITVENYKEVWLRVNALERMEGCWLLRSDGKSEFITLPQIKRWIGMSTNASPMTRTQFMKRLSRGMDGALRYLTD
jgi:hypothetical protein